MKSNKKLFSLLLVCIVAGCANVDQSSIGPIKTEGGPADTEAAQPDDAVSGSAAVGNGSQIQFSTTPNLPLMTNTRSKPSIDPVLAHLSDETIAVNFRDMPIGQFINEVFGKLLGLPFEIDDALSAREDLVTIRSEENQTEKQLYEMASRVLLNYGIGIENQDSHLRFVFANDPNNPEPPILITGSALPDVPGSHRTVYRFVQLKAVRENVVKGWLNAVFGGTLVTIESDPLSNSIVLRGPMGLVNEAAETVKLLDKPNMRGQYSVRITPSFVDATTLAKMLTDVLASEGIGAALKPPFGSVIVLPMAATNSIVVFAADPEVLDHVKDWATELDQPATQNTANDFFYYQVRNTSASDLAKALTGVQDTTEESGRGAVNTSIYVDKNRNGLILTGDPKEWKPLLPIIKSMDRPARLVSIEVTVASITLTDDTDLGIEWLFNDAHGQFTGSGGTNFGLGGSGFSYTLNNTGQVRFALNALSQDQRVSILSKPSILVKSGESASIDVGQEVPIITSQAQSTNSDNAPVLQNVSYRKTGVLLQVEPTVHSGGRVDLDVSQEVSEVLDGVANSVDSPSIFTRKINTSLTLADGGAVILGGLISGTENEGSNKVPGLGNIPVIGALFRSSGKQETRSELVLIIQAYIIDFEENNRDFNEQLRRKLHLLDIENLELN